MTFLRRIFWWFFERQSPLDDSYDRAFSDWKRKEYMRAVRHGG